MTTGVLFEKRPPVHLDSSLKNVGSYKGVCRFALLAMCDVYDGWEPDSICVLKGGIGCEIAVELSKKETSKQ
jgi:hypothetical protein